MTFISDIMQRLRALVFRGRAERELDEELREHLEMEVARRIKNGDDPATARRAAHLALGNVEYVKENVRDARGTRLLEEFIADARYALRSLRNTPGFALSAILVLGVGIGATTTVFTVADAVLFAGLPYANADRLVRLRESNGAGNRWAVSTADALGVLEHQRVFDEVGFVSNGTRALSGAGLPEAVPVSQGTDGFFRALSLSAAKGRLINAADQEPAAPPVAVVTDAFASERLGGAANAVGQSITLDGIGYPIVGVLPPGVKDLAGTRARIWTQLKLPAPTRRGPFWMFGVGRLKPGMTVAAAKTDLARGSRLVFQSWNADFKDTTAAVTPYGLRADMLGDADRKIGLFAGAVLLVLLLAIANVATLMLVRTSSRDQEFAVRLALGAGRDRLARLLVTESVVLTGLAGALGVAIVAIGTRVALSVAPAMPRLDQVSVNARAIGFAVLAAIVSGILVSLPAVTTALAGRVATSLRADAKRSGRDRRSNLIRSGLVVSEFALALPLLVGAALLFQSLLKLEQVEQGFDPRHVIAMSARLGATRYKTPAEVAQFWTTLEQRALELPGVTSAGLSSSLPPDEPNAHNDFDLIDRPVPAGGVGREAPWVVVTPKFYTTLGVRLIEGRHFLPSDSATGLPVAIVSEGWARKYYPGESAVGRKLVNGGQADPPTTVVGVVSDLKFRGLDGETDVVYQPMVQGSYRAMNLVVRSTFTEGQTIEALGRIIRSLDSDLPFNGITMTSRLGDALSDPKRWTAVTGSFAASAAFLAGLGVFGLMAYTVRQQRREIGVRLALGATPGSMTAMVVGRGIRFALVGTAIGLALTLVSGRWLASFMFGIGTSDPLTIVGIALVLVGTAALASWIPGLRAARVNAQEALSGS